MKIDRQIGILSILLQKDRITAAELAEKFEVSRRTVIRDIEDINKAGIPIVTSQGQGGGISIMEGFKIDRTVLSSSEMKAIIAGLQSLDSVSGTNRYRQLMDKLSAENSLSVNAGNHIIIDLSGWDKSEVSDKIELIKLSMDNNEKIAFTYYSPTGIGERVIEPYHLIFQWSSWYVWGWCDKRNDYRMFKLTRLTDLRLTGEKRAKRDVPEYACDKLRHTKGGIEAVVRFDRAVKWRLIDELGADNFTEDKNGVIEIRFTWSDKHSLFCWLLTFADSAEIIYPQEYREEFSEIVKKISGRYQM